MGTRASRQGRSCYPQLELVTETVGSYFRASNPGLDSGVLSRPNQPVQPRLADDARTDIHGVVFEGCEYTPHPLFDPVITRLGTSDELLGDETVVAGAQWMPSKLVSLS